MSGDRGSVDLKGDDSARWACHAEAGRQMPDPSDLMSLVRFAPNDGRIWLDNQRMLLLHSASLGSLRREMVDSLGVSRARTIMMRLGYASGALDAQLAARLRPEAGFVDHFSIGPQLHALEGVVNVDLVRFDADVKTGRYYGEFVWRDSIEDELQLSTEGLATEPACWMQLGYACGFTSAFMGRPIFYREVECASIGHAACRIVGKPIEEWNLTDDEVAYLRPDALRSGVSSIRTNPAKSGGAGSPLAQASVEFHGMVGASPAFHVACQLLQKVAETDATTLILGASGVGKEMFARTLHKLSSRSAGPFVAVNCAAIPEQLIEAELFGVVRGAFTGATETRPGRFERADGGTIFLDEIGTLSLPAQAKLLRVIQEREIERVGDKRTHAINVRVAAATNADLKADARAGKFREDLFFRLNVFPIRIPLLRERKGDIPLFLDHFMRRYCQLHKKSVTGFSERAISALLNYDWPGNVRELENIVERGIILAPDGGSIDVGHLFSNEDLKTDIWWLGGDGGLNVDVEPQSAPSDEVPVDDLDELVGDFFNASTSLEELEQRLLHAAVERADGNLSSAARMLGITRPQLAYRLKRES